MRAENARDHTRSLAARDPTWGSVVEPFAGGWLVLAGPGMYVNQAMVAGLGTDVEIGDLDLLVQASTRSGVAAAIEITAATSPTTVDRVERRGFVHDRGADITCLTRRVSADPVDAPDHVQVRPVASPAELALWQRTARAGWGHVAPAAIRASDAFAAAAWALDTEHMAIAFDGDDGLVLGCAAMTVREDLAMCGGMSTLPAHRRRGVQAALLRYRLALADRLGCRLALTTAAAGSASERNLRRHGFSGAMTIERFARAER